MIKENQNSDILELLSRQIKTGQLSHAYLFWGSNSAPKTAIALDFAKAIFESKKTGQSSENFQNSPDLLIIKPEFAGKTANATIKIEKIRQLIRFLSLSPHSLGIKIAVIQAAHNLNQESANALLKTLEEPPKNSLILLISDKPSLILPTILSRCQKIRIAGIAYQINPKSQKLFEQLVQGSVSEQFQLCSDLAERQKSLARVLNDWLVLIRDELLRQNQLADYTLNQNEVKLGKIAKLNRQELIDLIGQIIATKNSLKRNVNPKLALENLALCLD